jgi:hypothetical protein
MRALRSIPEGFSVPDPNAIPLIVKFGDDLMKDGFTAIPNTILDHYAELGITANEMLFVVHVWQFWWFLRDPYPGLSAIAARMGVQRRQAQRYAEGLREKGYLLTEQRVVEGRGQLSNEYDFTPLLRAVREHIKRCHSG